MCNYNVITFRDMFRDSEVVIISITITISSAVPKPGTLGVREGEGWLSSPKCMNRTGSSPPGRPCWDCTWDRIHSPSSDLGLSSFCEDARRQSSSPLNHSCRVGTLGEGALPKRNALQSTEPLMPGRLFASQPQEGALEQGLRGLGKQAKSCQHLFCSLWTWVYLKWPRPHCLWCWWWAANLRRNIAG